MELMTKQGYKQTDVGLIPEEWGIEKFKDVTNAITCGVAATPKYVSESLGMPFLSASHVQKGKVVPNKIKYITKDLYSQITKNNKPEKGDILYTRVGAGIGEAGVIDFELDFAIYVSLTLIKPKRILNNYFLRFLLNSNYYKFLAKNGQFAGGGVQNLNVEVVREFPIPIPTLTEQKAIATALSDVDALISCLEQTITKKKAIKQGAMQQLLTPPHKGGKRLPGFEGEWERVEVDKVITVARGGSPRPIQDFMTTASDGVNWIKIGDTSKLSKYITSTKEKIIPEGKQFSRSVNVGDFLLSNSMSFGRPYILKIEGCIHDGWLVLQNYQDSFDREFLYYTLMSKDVFDQYLSKASGSGVLNLNKELVKVVELNRPKDLDEQKAIAQILSDMDVEITQLESKKEKYQAIKQGMMQELLTGKTRLI